MKWTRLKCTRSDGSVTYTNWCPYYITDSLADEIRSKYQSLETEDRGSNVT